MNRLLFLLLLLIVTAPAAAERRQAGIFYRWGAFIDDGAKKSCFAVSRPPSFDGPPGASPYASIAFGNGRRGQIYARLRAAPRQGSAVLLRIDGRSFPMSARDGGAFIADPQLEAAALGLIRTGVTMAVEIRSASGARLRDTYPLRGAASAIDAAALACARR